MTLLTIYMPSKRSLEGSHQAIESALAYARHVDARLIVSDNSGDAEKRRWLETLSPRLHYVASDAVSAPDNWRPAFGTVETPFLMPMGDDDLIFFREDEKAVDLATLPEDVVGVRPATQIWTLTDGVRHTERFTIDADTPADRLIDYGRKVKGNNSIYYSIFRTRPFLSVMRSFVEHHPTTGGYIDWAICLSLFAAGRVVFDPSFTYRYDLGRWSRTETLNEAKAKLYTDAGLPADTEKFWGLLLFLDLYVFLHRLPLDASQRENANVVSRRLFLAAFLRSVIENPDRFDEMTRYIVDLIAAEQRLDSIFQLSVYLTDCIKPGLKDGYVRYYQAVSTA
ncbi:hypothetical protein [Pararhizobium arenae]|uniref:hypothetical protein n=1 Tax=Pararhizobium arenae TaxID=1856850 RepID=UPI00094B29E2|nr:hypothetical protein [Pararhizobium arenae]